MGLTMSIWFISCRAPFRSSRSGCLPQRTTSGALSRYAFAMPVRALVNPGPAVTRHTPGLPVYTDQAWAIMAAACSCRTSMARILYSVKLSRIASMCPPDMQNTVSTRSTSLRYFPTR